MSKNRVAKTWLSPSICYGRPVRTRTADLYRVKGQLTNTYNNLDGLEGGENTTKYV
jgi:hypothetical protein